MSATGSVSRQVELSDEEVKMLVEILRYSLNYCPIEGIGFEVKITGDQVQGLIAKLERALRPR